MSEYSQSYNRYAYCFNNPLKYIDPSGERMTDPPHTSMVLDYVSQMNTSGVYDSDLTRQRLRGSKLLP